MSRRITTVISFKIESIFEEWAKLLILKNQIKYILSLIFSQFTENSVKIIPKKLFALISYQREIFKSLFKQIVNGLKVTKLISQLWSNNLRYESF